LKIKIISIIVVTFNANKKIQALLSSIISQKFDDIELIIIDGNSTDGTKETLLSFKEYIDYFESKSDSGIYHAMNKGINNSSGEWLYFIGADDILVENAVEEMLSIISICSNSDLIIGNYFENYESHRTLIDQEPIKFKFQLLKGCINHQSLIIRKSLFATYGLYSQDLKFVSDYEFYFRIPIQIFKNAYYTKFPFCFFNKSGLSSINTLAVYKERNLVINKYCGKLIGTMYNLYIKYVSIYFRSNSRLQ
jgi:glycosyltransferase involved in cell wall biosynthesis